MNGHDTNDTSGQRDQKDREERLTTISATTAEILSQRDASTLAVKITTSLPTIVDAIQTLRCTFFTGGRGRDGALYSCSRGSEATTEVRGATVRLSHTLDGRDIAYEVTHSMGGPASFAVLCVVVIHVMQDLGTDGILLTVTSFRRQY